MQTIFDYAVIGVGAAGLSFLKERHQLINKKFIAIDKNIHTQKNHIFGFWNMPWTKELTRHSHKQWNAWSIISQDEEISFYSEKHKYEILYLDKWKNESLKSERDLVICQNNVRTIHKKNKIFEITLDNEDVCYAHNIIDSRSTKLDRKYLKQHFLGQTIKVKNPLD